MVEKNNIPLAERMRPRTLSEFVGQKHILFENGLLYRAVKANLLGNCIFYGPPGTGKTSLANIIANTTNANFERLNAVSSGVGDAKAVIEKAKADLQMFGTKTYLLLDECHRWNKAQSDCVLEAMEKGYIIFIGSTTENPYFSMTRAIVSRCRVFEFKTLTQKDIEEVLFNALKDERGLKDFNVVLNSDAASHLASASAGDVRTALNSLELAVLTTPYNENNEIVITKEIAEQSIQRKALSVDENLYYDILSAFCKSIRGSDAEAALYYSQRLIEAGCDPLLIARRLIAHASEDIGMADSNALLIAISALTAIKEIGFPEANLNLCHAIIYLCEAEKSNSVYLAMSEAQSDARQYPEPVPSYLKNNNNLESENPKGYKYPHSYGGYVKQQYMPAKLADRVYYKPSNNGRERGLVRKKDRNK